MFGHPLKTFKRQKGTTVVEFSIVGLVCFTVLFGAIEVSRLLFTVNMLEEGTRRGARMAVVCEVNDLAIQRSAIFNLNGGDDSPFIAELDIDNVLVEYLDATGATTNPGTPGSYDEDEYNDIRYVRVSIVDFEYDFLVPGLQRTFVTNSYPTVLPIESLGVHKGGERATCV